MLEMYSRWGSRFLIPARSSTDQKRKHAFETGSAQIVTGRCCPLSGGEASRLLDDERRPAG